MRKRRTATKEKICYEDEISFDAKCRGESIRKVAMPKSQNGGGLYRENRCKFQREYSMNGPQLL